VQRRDHIGAEAATLGDIGAVGADPQAIVAAAPEMFGEMAIQPR